MNEPNLSTASAAGGTVLDGLSRVRTRLLDLSARNKLLNFVHYKKSSLKIIKISPEKAFNDLISQEEFFFQPVPLPRLSDYPMLSADLAKKSEAEGLIPEIELSRKISAENHAEFLGLTATEDQSSQKGKKSTLQTLLYPADLEALLQHIASTARTAIDESGTNMLYLVFGFLEWYESDDSNLKRLAPLIAVPVMLLRTSIDPETNTYSYTLRYSGEDFGSNPALRERLKDFRLSLPEFDTEDDLRTYFQKCQEAVKSQPRWEISCELTLTLLSFGKLLMWSDLDPQKWQVNRIDDNPLIQQIFNGVRQEERVLSQEYDLDSLALQPHLPPLIFDADSSQHSALVDALQGRNLVIQGPPGTGKSQTITNLIAAAMVQGKSVLFVCEKLAALEVVRQRLDRAELGIFCLELHSHKTQKKQLIEELRTRLEVRGRFTDPPTLNQKLQELELQKKQLIAYAELINSKYGSAGKTIHEILWSRQRASDELPEALTAKLGTLLLASVEELDIATCEQSKQIINVYSQQVTALLSRFAVLHDHPWWGVENYSLIYFEYEELIAFLQAAVDSAESLISCLEDLNDMVSTEFVASEEVICDLLNYTDALPEYNEALLGEVLPVLSGQISQDFLESFYKKLSQYRSLNALLDEGFNRLPVFSEESISWLYNACILLDDHELSSKQLLELDQVKEISQQVKESTRQVLILLQACTNASRLDIACDLGGVDLLLKILELVVQAPVSQLSLRSVEVLSVDAPSILKAANVELEALRAERTRLEKSFRLSSLPDVTTLNRYIQVLANANFLSFFNQEYRNAKKAYLGFSRNIERRTDVQMAQDLRLLVNHFERIDAFETDHRYRALFGSRFNSLNTKIEDFEKLVNWISRVRTTLMGTREREIVCQKLISLREDALLELRDIREKNFKTLQVAHELTRQNNEVLAFLPKKLANLAQTDLSGFVNRLNQLTDFLAEFQRFCTTNYLKPALRVEAITPLVDTYKQCQQLAKEIDADADASALLGTHFAGVQTDCARLCSTLTFTRQIHELKLPEALKNWLLKEDTAERLRILCRNRQEWTQQLKNFQSSQRNFESRATLDSSRWHAQRVPESLDIIVSRIRRALSQKTELSSWVDYLRAREAANRIGAAALVELIEQSVMTPQHLEAAWQFVFHNSLLRHAFTTHPQLNSFSGRAHEQIRNRFAQLDSETIVLERQRMAERIDQRPVPEGNCSGKVQDLTELALVNHVSKHPKARLTIRQLVTRAGRALQALKPCFMMGPLSVAQYLEPGKLHFDLVIMDEASQMRPEDALGAIARASQVVIVGDSEQLPPTNFFARMVGNNEEMADLNSITVVEEAESILDVASGLYQPLRALRWHYRSRHESLIAFSNREFYNNNLIVFPSPVKSNGQLGVQFIPVVDGCFEGGRNMVEAQRVVRAVIEQMRNYPEVSLGVVALNAEQKELIEELFEQAAKNDPLVQQYVVRFEGKLEPFFVKNLENVQGDERDAIFISVTYGKAPNGKLSQNFGPINQSAGYRRLNVLFTRAKERIVVFSSIDPDDLRVEDSSSRGLRVLKNYLAYARTGILDQAISTGREPDSNFEVTVARALKERGYEVEPQVGVAGYFIDIAVKHPVRTGSYILAVECDGATYHSSRSARDRDRLRQAVLEGLRWKIHRVWSTDWFKNPKGEINRIVARIQSILEQEGAGTFALAESNSLAQDPPAETPPAPSVIQSTLPQQLVPELTAPAPGRPSLTPEQARAQLIELREKVIQPAHPEVPRQLGILRKTLLDALLYHRPTNRLQWEEYISVELRRDIPPSHLQYLDQILVILAAVS